MFVRIWIIGWIVLGTSDAIVYKIQTENSSGRNTETRDDTAIAKPDVNHGGVWSEWSEWTPCSRTCGGGVRSQIRTCIENRTDVSNKVYPDSPRIHNHKRKGHKVHKCLGISKRSHICNKKECPKETKDFLMIQCEYYNTKSFAGQYYSWQAYYDDKNQCSLNCRPLGFEFYARLNDTVIDGTSCKTATAEAGVCVDGKCEFVGCDGVIGGQRYDVCGVCGGDNSTCRLISGLFTRPHLVSGYNYIAEIPQYACNLSISEVKKTNNLIALKFRNGTYILNGDWQQSPTGSFEAVGTKFTYVRGSNNVGDSVSAAGPLLQPIDLLLLYRQINPGIKYEYMMSLQNPLRESTQNSLDGYNYYNEAAEQKINEEQERYKKFVTGEVSGYGGVSAESQGLIRDEEVKPKSKNKKKRFAWKITGYTPCSKTCGMGTQIPLYSCVKENNPQQTVAEKRCTGIEKPEKQVLRCNAKPCAAEWVVSNWSECSVTCGEGVETREILCKQEISPTLTVTVAEEACLTTPSPNLLRTRPCFRKTCGESSSSFKSYWKTGPWGVCSSKCGTGVKTRSVQCVSDQDEECPEDEKPVEEMICDMGPCNVQGSYSWYSTEWTQQCSESCGVGTQTRRIYCSAGAQLESYCDKNTKPEITRNCSNNEQCNGRWFSSPWSQCSSDCGWGKQYRTSACLAFSMETSNYTIMTDFHCKEKDKPVEEQACFLKPCNSQWFSGAWSTCSRSCDSGVQRREVRCLNEDLQPAVDCQEVDKPSTRRTCNTQKCSIYSNHEPDNIVESTTENMPPKSISRFPGISNSECQDKFNNCHLVAQARLCNYKYYQGLCCVSCYSFYHNSANNTSLSNNINA
ncbi:thrombospondin type-1 domain-containing protein 4-like [Planococcus citri]|uniref:thrombospondin type-1 domain-containing protein 4-like n=1 Tax=Planococcus citri TaxID=170843 RepID=UPI0031F88B1F